MVKIGKVDMRAALRDVVKSELDKQQKSDLAKELEKHYHASYSDYCQCGKIVTIDGKDTENTKIETIKEKKYLVGKCSFCDAKHYVKVVIPPPVSLIDTPIPIGIFYTESQVNGTQETDKGKKLTGGVWKP